MLGPRKAHLIVDTWLPARFDVRWSVPLLCLMSACDGGAKVTVDADFTLELIPIVPEDQALFGGDAELTVIIRDQDLIERLPLGANPDETWSLDERGALSGTRIGLLVTDPNAGIDPIDLRDVRAYGQTPPLELVTGNRELPVWVARFGDVGDLGTLTGSQISFVPAVTMLSNGDVLLFGGSDAAAGDVSNPLTGPALQHILRLDRRDADLAFQRVADLPAPSGAPEGRAAATATTITYDGAEAVLLAGGRARWVPANNGTNSLAIWDPAAQEVVESTTMARARSQHVTATLPDGTLVFLGGHEGTGLSGTFDYETYQPADGSRSEMINRNELHDVGFGWASIEDGTLIICGGGGQISAGDTYELSSGCVAIDPDGQARDRMAMGTGVSDDEGFRMWHAMAPLGGNEVLLTGGVTTAPTDGSAVPATADAFVFDATPGAQSWTRVADMNHARALHRAVPLVDGRVLIIGGTETGIGPGSPVLGAAVPCAELYNPDDGTFTEVSCVDAGLGALPPVATQPGYGAWVLAGMHAGGGGAAWGMAGIGPDID